ncbi:hypothetical protein [Brevibacillus migulae]|uniref:hypothetical protein n=1 Tax=Brevibacillus migulae TaxID=1644114 RepID=UPI0014317FC5|nr:hypothetical protein [Brevibacillus migulae]
MKLTIRTVMIFDGISPEGDRLTYSLVSQGAKGNAIIDPEEPSLHINRMPEKLA